MRKLILMLSLMTITSGAVSTSVYAADFNTLKQQLNNCNQAIVQQINQENCNINDVLSKLQGNKNVYTINNASDLSVLEQFGIDTSKLNNCFDTTDSTKKATVKETKKTEAKKKAKKQSTKAKAKKETKKTESKAKKETTKTVENKQKETTTPKTTKPTEAATKSNASYVEQVVKLVNAERAKAGLKALTIDTNLAKAANKRAQETITSFSHTRPNGSSFGTVLKEYNVSYNGAGENIAYGQKTPEEVMEGWMNSPGHRANILNAKYTKIGVGYVQNANGVNYWSQLFTY